MPACVECTVPVASLYTEYGRGNCGKFADKYIEFDNVIVFIDMLLHKPQVYRHLLYNKLGISGHSPNPSKYGRFSRLGTGALPWGIVKLCLLLVFFEVYIKWAKIDRDAHQSAFQSPPAFIGTYIYLFSISFLEFALFQLLVRIISVAVLGWNKVSPKMDSIIAGLVLSNFGKLLHVVMVIWDYNDMEFSYLIKMTVFTSNLEALSAIFAIKYSKSALILCVAIVGRYAFQLFVHHYDPTFPLSLL